MKTNLQDMLVGLEFLSHLSGDEVNNTHYFSSCFFLSHLSGDEVKERASYGGTEFLSHLSGDEDFVV